MATASAGASPANTRLGWTAKGSMGGSQDVVASAGHECFSRDAKAVEESGKLVLALG